jgi:hypothetical protein
MNTLDLKKAGSCALDNSMATLKEVEALVGGGARVRR